MRVPQSVDKWIVFATILAAAAIDVAFSTWPGAGVLERVIIPVIFALIGTGLYVVWCVLCRFLCRLIDAETRARFVANGLAALAFALVACWPLLFPAHAIAETVELPGKSTTQR
jgi:hypothetical protein